MGGVCAGGGFGCAHRNGTASPDISHDLDARVRRVHAVRPLVRPGEHPSGIAAHGQTDHLAKHDEVVAHRIMPVLRSLGIAARAIERMVTVGVDDRVRRSID